MNPDGKVVLVSGGGSGLGAAVSRALVAEGARVVIADADAERSVGLAAELGENAEFVETDVTDWEQAAAAAAHCVSAFGGLQGAVACAGIGSWALALSEDRALAADKFARAVSVNLIGTFNVAIACAPAIADGVTAGGEDGVLVTVSSVAAFEGQIGQAGYSASKAGVAGMTLPLARELASAGIRVVSIAPGLFDTPMMGNLREDTREALVAQVPFPPRLGRPEEFAGMVLEVFRNEMLNGSVIRLDGAIRMS